MKRQNGRANQGYLINSVIHGRNHILFDADENGLVPYMDGYKIIPLEMDELQRVEMIDSAFDVAVQNGYIGYQFPAPKTKKRHSAIRCLFLVCVLCLALPGCNWLNDKVVVERETVRVPVPFKSVPTNSAICKSAADRDVCLDEQFAEHARECNKKSSRANHKTRQEAIESAKQCMADKGWQ